MKFEEDLYLYYTMRIIIIKIVIIIFNFLFFTSVIIQALKLLK